MKSGRYSSLSATDGPPVLRSGRPNTAPANNVSNVMQTTEASVDLEQGLFNSNKAGNDKSKLIKATDDIEVHDVDEPHGESAKKSSMRAKRQRRS